MAKLRKEWVDLRTTFSWWRGRKIYVALLVGRDQRGEHAGPASVERRQNSPWLKAFLGLLILGWTLAGGFGLTVGALYLAKTWANIDLVKGASPFPDFLRKIRLCH